MNKLKRALINLIVRSTPKKLRNIYRNYDEELKFASLSYSQEGEDMILKRIFESQKNGFYIDVGAHHPKRFSNT
ncbi:MAG: SAM-dependent methyltransferase, partial [Patescibacteria group bacterium]|nr:SAM-dependent methyltransferase [Patescibacteria group bacterium]